MGIENIEVLFPYIFEGDEDNGSFAIHEEHRRNEEGAGDEQVDLHGMRSGNGISHIE